jgi:hypothetical protein
MKVVIRNAKTGLYLNPDGWVNDVDSAHDFVRGADAIGFAMHNGLSDIEVLHAFPEPCYNISTGVISFQKRHRGEIALANSS